MNNTMITTSSQGGGDAVKVSPMRILTASAIAVVLNLLVLWIGSTAGASLVVAAPEPITALTVATMTLAPLLLMGAVVWLLDQRFTLRRLAGWAGLIFALASSAGSLLAAADAATALTLAAMHVITGCAWFIALLPWVRSSYSSR